MGEAHVVLRLMLTHQFLVADPEAHAGPLAEKDGPWQAKMGLRVSGCRALRVSQHWFVSLLVGAGVLGILVLLPDYC